MKVLVVTRMWPTEQRSFRNGFVAVQVEALRAHGVSCEVLVAQGQARGLRLYAQVARSLRRRIAGGAYDLVHAHSGLTGAAARCQLTCPVVVTFHGSDLMGAPGKHGLTSARGMFEAAVSRGVARAADAVILVSPRLKERLPTGVRAEVVPVGVDERTFKPLNPNEARRLLGLQPDARYVLFAADPAKPVKRHHLALHAMRLVQEALPNAKLLTVFGRRINEMPLWMNAADVVLVTSTYEGGPMVVKEAMACNVPIVSVDVGDVAERIAGLDHCHLVTDNPRAIADGLKKVLVSPGVRTNGRVRVRDFTAERTARSIAALYQRILVSQQDTRGWSRRPDLR